MRKPFTVIAGLLLLVVATAQAARAYFGFDVIVDGYHIPIVASWAAAGVAGLLGLMLFSEAGR